jgi:FMN-dependent NADH-azoreductase
MRHLLHLDSSARREGHSRQLSARYAEAWRTAHPDGRYTYRDLTARPVPFVDEAWTEICDYALAHGITDPARLREGVTTSARRAAWAVIEPLLTELTSADELLLGVPMYNYGVPACLKAWIDQVTFPRARLDARVVVAGARGGTYAPGTPRELVDHQERYLRDFFAGHFAVQDTVFLNAELANSRQDPALAQLRAQHDDSYRTALAAARRLGKEY